MNKEYEVIGVQHNFSPWKEIREAIIYNYHYSDRLECHTHFVRFTHIDYPPGENTVGIWIIKPKALNEKTKP